MSKGFKVVLIVLIACVTLLAASTGFFYAKTKSLQKKVSSSTTKNTDSATTKDISDKSTQANVSTSTSTSELTAAPAGNQPSSPSDTVTVGNGETLFEIGQKVDVSWTLIGEANGIDADKIKAGQTLIIPKNNEVGYTINQEKAQSLQKDVDGGKYAFRLSPVDTAKSDSPSVYGLMITDTFTQVKIDETAGSAEVSASKAEKIYLIKLVQPVTKGAKGIWAIESIKPQSA